MGKRNRQKFDTLSDLVFQPNKAVARILDELIDRFDSEAFIRFEQKKPMSIPIDKSHPIFNQLSNFGVIERITADRDPATLSHKLFIELMIPDNWNLRPEANQYKDEAHGPEPGIPHTCRHCIACASEEVKDETNT